MITVKVVRWKRGLVGIVHFGVQVRHGTREEKSRKLGEKGVEKWSGVLGREARRIEVGQRGEKKGET